jgi:hypothetical protein
MAAIGGLTGIAGYQVQINRESQATPEQRSGNTVDPKHGERGEVARPYSWESQMTPGGSHGPYGPENQFLGDPEWVWQPAGTEWDDPDFDHTPSTHAAPFMRGTLSGPVPSAGPDDIARQLVQSWAVHGIDMGASSRLQTSLQEPLNDSWDGYDNLNPGNSDTAELPDQYKSSSFMWGTTDRRQSFARQNEFGFDSAHMHRRYATGEIPGNNMWLRPGGRVMQKSLPGPARPPIGPTSPFAGQNMGQAFSTSGAILSSAPTEYVAPPQVNLVQPAIGGQYDSVVEWY